jgi:hypothetical protein
MTTQEKYNKNKSNITEFFTAPEPECLNNMEQGSDPTIEQWSEMAMWREGMAILMKTGESLKKQLATEAVQDALKKVEDTNGN